MGTCTHMGCYQRAETEREDRLKAKKQTFHKNDFPDNRKYKEGTYIGHFFRTRIINGKCYFHNRFKGTEAIE